MCECKCIYGRSVHRLQQLLDEAKAANSQYEVDLDEAQNLAGIYREERDELLKHRDRLQCEVHELGEELARIKIHAAKDLNRLKKERDELQATVNILKTSLLAVRRVTETVRAGRDRLIYLAKTQPSTTLTSGQEIVITIKIK